MTLRIPAKVLIHVWSYDFYDMTLSTGKQRCRDKKEYVYVKCRVCFWDFFQCFTCQVCSVVFIITNSTGQTLSRTKTVLHVGL